MLRRLPVRWRLTLAFATAMTVLFGAVGVGVYLSMAAALLDELDTGLRFRAATVLEDPTAAVFQPTPPDTVLVEQRENLGQIVATDGTVLQSSLAPAADSLLDSATLTAIGAPTLFQRTVPGFDGVVRLLAVPVTLGARPAVVIVGASMSDRRDALLLLVGFLAVGEPVALAIACALGWLVAGAALRPVEQMRRQADAISASGPDRRLSVPAPEDELRRLARTLNAMLDRLQESFEGERRFLDTASHELRTPLAALKTELDLALSRPRSLAEAQAALHSASEETDRLAQLADDLLVLSRAHRGRLPVHRAATSLAAVVGAARTHVAARAEAAGVQLRATAPAEWVHVDETRLRQALDNLLDNALRHTPSGGVVQVQATVEDGAVRVVVDDSGPGFPPDAAAMTLSQPGRLATGFGLGLAIVSAVAAGHGGGVTTITRPEGGGRVIVTLAEATD